MTDRWLSTLYIILSQSWVGKMQLIRRISHGSYLISQKGLIGPPGLCTEQSTLTGPIEKIVPILFDLSGLLAYGSW